MVQHAQLPMGIFSFGSAVGTDSPIRVWFALSVCGVDWMRDFTARIDELFSRQAGISRDGLMTFAYHIYLDALLDASAIARSEPEPTLNTCPPEIRDCFSISPENVVIATVVATKNNIERRILDLGK